MTRISSSVDPVILERSTHPISRRDIDPNVLKVLYRLIGADYIAYLVGGGVRDLMMRRRPKDFDVATSAHPHQVRELFRNSRLIGRRFRLVHVFFGSQIMEVATFRRRGEDAVDSGDPMIRQDNTFGTPEEDAFRRDFTINTLFYDPRTFQVIDYVGGVPDLEARLIRSVGDADVRMREDPVRMIRAVRFAVKLDFEIEPTTRAAIERHASDLAKASVPRLVEEIFRTLTLADAGRALLMMERLGLLAVLLPAISDHLRSHPATPSADLTAPPNPADDLEPPRFTGESYAAPTARNLAALGRLIAEGLTPSRPLLLATLFADLFRVSADPRARANLITDLRMRGFSRADTDQMRLLLEAVGHMMAMTRQSRRIERRPYYADARRLLELIAPTYGFDVVTFDRFLATPPGRPTRRRGPAGQNEPLAESAGTASATTARRRRRRRGGRRHRRISPETLATPSPLDDGAAARAAYSAAAAPACAEPFANPRETPAAAPSLEVKNDG